MRVTENLTFSQMKSQIGSAQSRAFDASNVASSGVRVAKSSDDPTAYARAMVMQQGLSNLDAMSRGSSIATSDLTTADDALAASERALTRAREIAVAGANTTLGPSDRTSYADEVAQLRSSLLAQANVRNGDTYVFSGGRTAQPAFDAAGAFQGDASVRQIEVSPNTQVAANVPGDTIFTPAGGVNVFDALATLEANLRGNNITGITAQLDVIDRGHAQITEGRTAVGLQLQRAQDSGGIRDSVRLQIQNAKSAAVEADPASSYSSLLQAQQALEAAMAAAQRMLSSMDAGLKL